VLSGLLPERAVLDGMPVNPPFSFDRCDRCGQPKDILEAMYLEHCEVDIELERKRPALYAALGLNWPASQPR